MLSSSDCSIVVIVPFYQKQSGILRKAVLSVLRQIDVPNVRIIVVDDGSPTSARGELVGILHDYPDRIAEFEQSNAGPAAARNKGLDKVPAGTRYVAFLDSDDEWIAAHLANAIKALNHGFDFYFSDHFQLNQTVSAFNRAKRITIDQHPKVAGTDHLRKYEGDMFDQILMGNIIGTSTVVYHFAAFPKLRFREEFVYAGEDYLFWLELSKLTQKIAFSVSCECTYGAGINIFSASGWGTEKSLTRLHYEIKFKKALPRIFKLSDAQRASNTLQVKILRRSFVADLLHRIAHRTLIGKKLLNDHFRIDPQTFLYFVPLTVFVALKST